MHSFLRSVGFTEINSKKEENELIKLVMEQRSETKVLTIDKNSKLVEYYLEVADNVGVIVCGETDESGKFFLEYYFPIIKGHNMSTREEVYINKRVDTDAYTGMCDDYRIGVSLIFYLQNRIDYLNADNKKRKSLPIAISALASEGKILFPVQKSVKCENKINIQGKSRAALIAEAKKGDQEAIEKLTIDDIDQYAMVNKRIKKEDIYTIVDTSFIPYGSESDNYTILGYIKSLKKVQNLYTKESLYIMDIECNELTFEVCINASDLMGEPEVGRRFKGNIWLQGAVGF